MVDFFICEYSYSKLACVIFPHSFIKALPSKNKKPFTSEFGLEVKCKDFCALNTFYVDQDTMLQTFPRLKEKYMLYSQSTDLENPFMVNSNLLLHLCKWGEREKRVCVLVLSVNAICTVSEMFYFPIRLPFIPRAFDVRSLCNVHYTCIHCILYLYSP